MNAEELFAAIGGVDDDLIEQCGDKIRTVPWVRWGALAACLVLVVGLVLGTGPLRLPIGSGGASSGASPEHAGGSGGQGITSDNAGSAGSDMTSGAGAPTTGESVGNASFDPDLAPGEPPIPEPTAGPSALAPGYMFYAGPIFPLTVLEDTNGLTAERHIDFDFSPWVSSTNVLVTDTYTLTNTTSGDKTVTVRYPFAAHLNDPDQALPTLRLDGTALDAEICYDSYSNEPGTEPFCWLSAQVTVPAGSSVEIAATMTKPANTDYCGSDNGRCGYDMVTKSSSSLTFTGQTASVSHTDGIRITDQDFGFDPESGVTQVALDMAREHYFLEIGRAE